MVGKDGATDGSDALKAYKAAREEHEHAAELDEQDEVSSALVEKVMATSFFILEKSFKPSGHLCFCN